MSSALIDKSAPDASTLHPVLLSTSTKFRMICVRLLAYASGLAVLAALLGEAFTGVPAAATAPVFAKADWIIATRPQPAFTINHLDLSKIPEPYQIIRHPEGGRKDTLRWTASAGSKTPGEKPNTEIEIYRPGAELAAFGPFEADIATRIGLPKGWTAEAGGIVASKFGAIPLARFAAPDGVSCLAFARSFDNPRVRISGWSCQPVAAAALRTFIACTLDRLVLLSAGNDPMLAGLFAKAELRRTGCATASSGGQPGGDWIAATQEPSLRGAL
ncbi:MAG: hypothetical protein K2X60_10145 [Xanthobacteraceae bacterium]|nr:hypothetical protein [Xanthobacteraceae bacterium]